MQCDVICESHRGARHLAFCCCMDEVAIFRQRDGFFQLQGETL